MPPLNGPPVRPPRRRRSGAEEAGKAGVLKVIGVYRSMGKKLGFTLPIVLGALSAALMVWDIFNLRVIASMGMAWDTGAPLWPYQTPDILFSALNTPAYALAAPALYLFRSIHYVVLFPCVLLWWWFVGVVFDKRLLQPAVRKGWTRLTLSSLFAAIFVILGAFGSWDTFRWWQTYGDSFLSWRILILLRSSAPSIWCFILSSACVLFAVRLAKIKRTLG
jgi:hypothetical protein